MPVIALVGGGHVLELIHRIFSLDCANSDRSVPYHPAYAGESDMSITQLPTGN